MKVTFEGEAELSAKFRELVAKARGRQVEAALRAGALIIQNSAKDKAPYVVGNLMRSITNKPDGHHATAHVKIGTNIEYGPYVELGTSRRRPKPYLRPAFEENVEAAKREIVAALEVMVTP